MRLHVRPKRPSSVSAPSQLDADSVMGQRHGRAKEPKQAANVNAVTSVAATTSSKPAVVGIRGSSWRPEVDASTSTSGRQLVNNASLQRPQSAMAGSLIDGDHPSSAGGQSGAPQAFGRLESQSAGPSPSHHKSVTRVKITRVRINSTSEQIQDPKWLIKMSEEQEERRREKRNHLKYLHRKLKSTIIGGSDQGRKSASGPSACTSTAGSLVVTPPVTPVKMPVSILKQRQQQTVQQQPPPPPPTTSASRARLSPAGVRAQSSVAATSASVSSLASSPGQGLQESQQAQAQAKPQVIACKPAKVMRPICADGQVRVSGWKRKNLIAKTLGHLDEIRGNQRPIFAPTTIHVASKTQLGFSKQSSARSKFVDVVREAISRKADAKENCDHTSLPDRCANEPKCASSAPTPVPIADEHQARPLSVEPSTKAREPTQARLSWSGQQQVSPSGGHTPRRTPSGGQQAQLQAQLLSHLLITAAECTPAQGASQRDFKLQHKNNQLLQSLRRQSNELAAAEANRLGSSQADTKATSPKSGPGHRNDWRRLTGKLALLTVRPQLAGSSIKLVDHLIPCDSTVSGSKALRQTLSNQEERLNSSAGNALLLPAGEKRKLSSSSMVVQPSSSPSFSDRPSSLGDSLKPNQARRSSLGTQHRRCSDSDAHRKSLSSSSQEPAKSVPSGSPSDHPRTPVIVRGDDLRLLLQVSGNAPFGEHLLSRKLSASSLTANFEPPVQGDSPPCDEPRDAEARLSRATKGLDEKQLEQRQHTRHNLPDLGSIVKKTSRVAFFQQKLRKIRRNQAQAKQTQSGQLEQAVDPSNCEPGGEQLLVDPMLIGDAIEMFLRSAMQQSGGNGVECDLADVTTMSGRTGATAAASMAPGSEQRAISTGRSELLQVEDKPSQEEQKSSSGLLVLGEVQPESVDTRVMSS